MARLLLCRLSRQTSEGEMGFVMLAGVHGLGLVKKYRSFENHFSMRQKRR